MKYILLCNSLPLCVIVPDLYCIHTQTALRFALQTLSTILLMEQTDEQRPLDNRYSNNENDTFEVLLTDEGLRFYAENFSGNVNK